ncbi:MAG: DUF5615 family PIN-like protein [Chloroflexi bacterium]|nr:DUF5615 family PIN-like protein [Chloroflexota bacterium]
MSLLKFLIDRCAGHRLAVWLRSEGDDVLESRERGADPGDRTLLEWAVAEQRVLVTIDTDFGELLFSEHRSHFGYAYLVLREMSTVTPSL